MVGYKQHCGVLKPRAGQTPAWSWSGGRPEGFVWRRVHASQLILHWAGTPEIARGWWRRSPRARRDGPPPARPLRSPQPSRPRLATDPGPRSPAPARGATPPAGGDRAAGGSAAGCRAAVRRAVAVGAAGSLWRRSRCRRHVHGAGAGCGTADHGAPPSAGVNRTSSSANGSDGTSAGARADSDPAVNVTGPVPSSGPDRMAGSAQPEPVRPTT